MYQKILFKQCLQNYDKDKTVDLDFLVQTMKELTEKYSKNATVKKAI